MLVVMRQMPLDRRNVDWRGQKIDDRVEQRLHALVLERRSAQHGYHPPGDGRHANGVANLVRRQLRAAQVLFHQRLVEGDGMLDRRVPGLLDLVLHVGWYVDDGERLA